MKNWLTKKLTSLLLVSSFLVVGFGFFVNTAYANPHTPPFINDILEDYWLLLPGGTLLYDTRELDDGLYTNTYEGNPLVAKYELDYPVEQSQVDKILSNIANDGAVVSALQKYNTTFQTWEMLNDECNSAYDPFFADCYAAVAANANTDTSVPLVEKLDAARYALDASLEALSLAVPAARERQQSLIDSFVAKNEADALFMQSGNAITGGEETAQSALAAQEGADIGNQTPITGVPLSEEEREALRQQQQDIVSKLTDDRLNDKMHDACSFGIPSALGGSGKPMNFTPCIANVVYSIVYKPTMYALMGSGYIFDQVLGLSIDSEFVDQPFVNTLWTVIRDFANMLFIFILLYTGIMTIFGETNWRKTILQVIFIALIINFSLFFTKVIIDAGNILAVGVKSAIASGGSISEGLVAGFQPQKFVSYTSQGDTSGGDAIIIFLISALVTGFAAYIFFMAAILFTRRLIVFWALMILSPFAFISTAIPGKSGEFHKWLGTLVSQAFVAPVFLFFIYMIMIGISSGILDELTIPGTGWFVTLLVPVMISMLLIKALQEALKFTENMAGSTGSMVSGLVTGALGLATGGASSLVGAGLRKGVGGYAARKLASGTLAEGSAYEKAAQWATRASFDVRSAPLPSFAAKGLGSLGIKVGKAGGAGGVEKEEKDRLDAALKAAGAAKANVFQEQGVYSRVQSGTGPEIAKHQAKIATARAVAETASGLTAQLKAQAEAEKKADDDSSAAVKTAKTNYDAAVKGGNQELINDAKDALEKAESSHAAAGSSVALQATLAKLEEAKKAEKEAVDALDKVAKKTVADIAKEAIAASNEVRKEAYADVVGSGGIFIGGEILPTKANALAAAKIRAGDKASKKTVKELLDEALKETGEKKEEEPKAEAKH